MKNHMEKNGGKVSRNIQWINACWGYQHENRENSKASILKADVFDTEKQLLEGPNKEGVQKPCYK